MTTNRQQSGNKSVPSPLQKVQQDVQQVESSQPVQDVEKSAVMQKGVGPLRAFMQKFNNDWTINLQAGALAYNLVVAIFPILIALFLIFGLVLGGLAPDVKQSFIHGLSGVLPKEWAVVLCSSCLIEYSVLRVAWELSC